MGQHEGIGVKRQSLFFIAPHQVEIREEPIEMPIAGQVLVQTLVSAISSGTELLVYRGLFPDNLAVDETISALAGHFAYPLKYGYSVVGKVVDTGPGVDRSWLDRTVFAFHPHESHFPASLDSLLLVPAGISIETAALLPNAETAVNFLLDGQPLIGERVVVFGQGIVGLLTTALLACFPLDSLVCVDRFALRRAASEDMGAHASFNPDSVDFLDELRAQLLKGQSYVGADLVYELSGHAATLDQAIVITGFNGRIVVGSWYGQKRASLDLGGYFHRSRIRLISSQVSTMTPELSGRWNKSRRLDVAWKVLRQIDTQRLITHRFPHLEAPDAYALLDRSPEQTIQVLLTYGST